MPAAWLGFSLTYSRGDYRESLARWRIPLAILGLLPIGLALGFREQLLQVVPAGPAGEVLLLRFGAVGTALNVVLLVAFVLVLMNLEQTFRAAVGTMRWRLKFVVLGLAVIFGAQIYVRSQAILFSAPDLALSGVESSALLIGGLFLALAYARTGLAETDVYPSRAVLRSSLTVLIVGGYLFIVGVLAQIVRRIGGAESFQFQAFVVLLGMAGLAVLLLSDRLRQRIHGFVGRHFRKAQHDSVRIWTELLAAAGASEGPGRPLRGVREVDFRDLRRAVGHRLAARTSRRARLIARRLDRTANAGGAAARQSRPRRQRRAPLPPACGRGPRRSTWKRSTSPGPRNCGNSTRRRSPRTAATAGVFRCGPAKRCSAPSCWPTA